jgi:Big-like domain-containing protein
MKRFCLLLCIASIAGCGGGDNGPSSITSVVITGDSTVVLNGTLQLTATALAGNVPLPGVKIVWISSDSSKVAVSQTGLVRGLQLASATITAIAVPDVSPAVSSAPYTIRSRIGKIVFRPFDISLTALHDTVIVSADARDALNASIPGISFTWRSGNTSVVTVADSGTHSAMVVAVANGTTQVVATGASASDSLTASVQQLATSVAIVPGSFDSLTAFGRKVQASCVALDSRGDTIPNQACTWSAGTPGVVSFTPATAHTDTITAVGNGRTTFQAQAAPGVVASSAIAVHQIPKTVRISPANFGTVPDVTLTTNQSAPFFATVLDSLDHPALQDSVTWASSDTTRAKVAATATLDSTLVTTLGVAGTATITATSGPASASRVVNVSGTPISFATDIQSIFNSSTPPCINCHPSAAGQDLTTGHAYSNIVNVASTEVPAMKRVRPFMPDSSYLVHKIQGTQASVGGSGVRMPYGCTTSCLPDATINTIRNWILQGAQNN